MDEKAKIRAYFDGFRTRDRDRIAAVLATGVTHTSPWARYEGRDAMLDDIWPQVGRIWATELEIFGDGPGYMVRYRQSDGSAELAEFFRFEDGLVREIIVYPGPVQASKA